MSNQAAIQTKKTKIAQIFEQTADMNAPHLVVIEGGVNDAPDRAAGAKTLYYVHSIIPAQNADIGAKGECNFKMLCFEIPQNMMAAQMRAHYFAADEAKVIDYRGFISRAKGEAGMVAGHVYMFEGQKPVGNMMLPAPKYKAASRYDDLPGSVGGYEAEIAVMQAVQKRRYPVKEKAVRPSICGG